MKSKKVEPFLTNQSNRGTSTVSKLTKPFIRLLTTVESAQRNIQGKLEKVRVIGN